MNLKVVESREHLLRSELFLGMARTATAGSTQSALLLAAVNSAVAFYENLRSACETGFIAMTMEEMGELFESRVRRFHLLELLRIHDFHRRPISLSPGRLQGHGPWRATVTQPGSSAALVVSPEGIAEAKTFRNASVRANRPISINGYLVQDPDNDEMVDIFTALEGYLASARTLSESSAFDS